MKTSDDIDIASFIDGVTREYDGDVSKKVKDLIDELKKSGVKVFVPSAILNRALVELDHCELLSMNDFFEVPFNSD
ncbi:MAG TPA: hypothetical protein VGQ99_21520 [Tepidisphaeraceae bacterium]|nr:hypothetical protein [Tepidisphaeraceae bacterium]